MESWRQFIANERIWNVVEKLVPLRSLGENDQQPNKKSSHFLTLPQFM